MEITIKHNHGHITMREPFFPCPLRELKSLILPLLLEDPQGERESGKRWQHIATSRAGSHTKKRSRSSLRASERSKNCLPSEKEPVGK